MPFGYKEATTHRRDSKDAKKVSFSFSVISFSPG